MSVPHHKTTQSQTGVWHLLSQDSNWRINLARQIATRYNATAALLVGSSAYGLSDAYSDVDILMYWHQIPTEKERVTIAEHLGGHFTELGDTSAEPKDDPALQSQSEAFAIGAHDLKIDITHILITAQQKLIDDVILRYETHPYKLGAIEGISHGVALSGATLIEKWLNEIRPLPDALAHKLMQQYSYLWAHQVVQNLLIDRDDVLFANRIINDMCEKVVYMLWVANAQYPPLRLKHLTWIIESLKVKPMNLKTRIAQICSSSPAEALPIAVQLVEDTFDIVTTQGFNINDARTHFNTERKANIKPITLNEETNNA